MFKFWKKGKRSQDESEQQDPEKKIPKPKKHPKGMYDGFDTKPSSFLFYRNPLCHRDLQPFAFTAKMSSRAS